MAGLLQILGKTVDNEAVRDKLINNPERVYFPNFGSGDNILKEGIDIDRVIFTIPGTKIDIYWYGFLIMIGVILAMIYGFRKMKSVGVDPDRAIDAVIGGFIGAIVGARAYYIIFDVDGLTFKDFFNIRDGGLAIYGGIIGALIVGCIIAKIRKLKVSALLDVVAPCFLIGQCVGRWGNFFNQEAFGTNTDLPWGMLSYSTANFLAERDVINVNQFAPVHPCFLYESIWCLIGFFLLNWHLKHRCFDGENFLMYIGWYGLGRFFIEGLRTDSLYIGNIRVSQLVAGTCVLASVILIIIFRINVKRNGNYKFFYETETSKAQLKEYNSYSEEMAEKKELKKKIQEAKSKGESFVELQHEYDEKFGKEAQKAKKQAIEKAEKEDKDNKENGSDEKYESIVEEENADKKESDEKSEGKNTEED